MQSQQTNLLRDDLRDESRIRSSLSGLRIPNLRARLGTAVRVSAWRHSNTVDDENLFSDFSLNF